MIHALPNHDFPGSSGLRMHQQPGASALQRAREEAIAKVGTSILVTDPARPDNPVVEANAAFERLTGYSREEVLGRNCRFLQGADTDPVTVRDIGQAIRSETGITRTVLNYRKDGSAFWNEMTVTPVRDAWGRLTHFTSMQIDVSERMRIAELEAALAAEREANRRKAEFFSVMSHELRTPMNAIVGYSHLLLENDFERLTPTQTADMRQIADSADQLLTLIDDILDVARIEAGRMPVTPGPVDIRPVIDLVFANVAVQAAAKDLALQADVAAGFPDIWADAHLLPHVLQNLVSNAVKFTERGSVRIVARVDGELGCLTVIDTGVGMSEDALSRVFDRFRQADPSTSRTYGGSGLGLAIAKDLTELQGGAISVMSTPGLGSTFTVGLPLAGTAGAAAWRAAPGP